MKSPPIVRGRYRYEGGYAASWELVPESRRAEIREGLKRASEATAGAYERFATKETDPPRRRCDRCKGTGVRSWEGPYAGSCRACRGLGTVAMSDDEIRARYVEIRKLVCKSLGTTKRVFDGMVSAAVPEGSPPAVWYRVAEKLIR